MANECTFNTWFIGDTHFQHHSILRFREERRNLCGASLEEDRADAVRKHDEWLVKLWNDTIKKKDVVYIIGDFCLGNKEYTQKLLNRLHGKKYLIFGNHDKSCKGLQNYFEWCGDIKEVKFTNDQYRFIDPNETFCIEMCHYPLLTWNRRPHGTCMVHGHCHNSITDLNTESGELRVDVGLDSELANYGIVSLEKLYNHFKAIKESKGCETFQEYAEQLMQSQGFRM